MTKPDFADVKSFGAAQRLASGGKLVKVLAFPAELGGLDASENVIFITPAAAEARELVIGTLTRFVKRGLIDTMTVEPAYRGDSVVPTRIVFHASHTKKDGCFEPAIEVW